MSPPLQQVSLQLRVADRRRAGWSFFGGTAPRCRQTAHVRSQRVTAARAYRAADLFPAVASSSAGVRSFNMTAEFLRNICASTWRAPPSSRWSEPDPSEHGRARSRIRFASVRLGPPDCPDPLRFFLDQRCPHRTQRHQVRTEPGASRPGPGSCSQRHETQEGFPRPRVELRLCPDAVWDFPVDPAGAADEAGWVTKTFN